MHSSSPGCFLELKLCCQSMLKSIHAVWVRQLYVPARSMSSQTTTHQLSDFVSRQVQPGFIDFSVGQPSPDLLPLGVIQTAANHRLSSDANSKLLLQYGPFAGYKGFRSALADFLSKQYQCCLAPEQLMVTAGVSHGLDLVLRHISKPGDAIFVECPTYFLSHRIMEQNRLQPVCCPTDDDGIDVDWLQHRLEAGHAVQQEDGSCCGTDTSLNRAKLMYIIPVHNNPRASTLSLARRRQLVQLAHDHGITIVADEVYQMLSFPGSPPPPPPLRAVEQQLGLAPSKVVSLSSFSKILAPGLRLGGFVEELPAPVYGSPCRWIEADPELLKILLRDGTLGSGGCIASLQAGIVHSALELGLVQQHLHQEVLPRLQQCCDALCCALDRYLPECTYLRPCGGYFTWLKLPDKVCSKALLACAETQHKVCFTPGDMCGPGQGNYIRLCFAFYTPEEIEEGVQRLATALHSFSLSCHST